MGDTENFRTWRSLGVLRWLQPEREGLFTPDRVLQQAWLCPETGEREWRDVPTEAVR